MNIDICCGGFWHNERNILEYILRAMLSRWPAVWILTERISSSSSEEIQILGMRCQPLIASQGSSGSTQKRLSNGNMNSRDSTGSY
ncbi:hypothetical protein F7725_003408 [Dissostichus mawsoni]|uniref:Uncharacterized protein n=1 Tax=Dissostichus mawsoni TaxID=36200 RepID=A0A7J5YA83_DISMA|nr:hypothetical protein F7725_003408 [Dissostichus mawsoni]